MRHLKSDNRRQRKPYRVISRLLSHLMAAGEEFRYYQLEAVICNDGLVIFDLQESGAGVTIIKSVRKADFNLRLTDEEIQEFNGGAGLRERYFEEGKA